MYFIAQNDTRGPINRSNLIMTFYCIILEKVNNEKNVLISNGED